MSKIIVIGGTGYAGRAIVAEAASRGHQVASISRSVPDDRLDGVEYLTGNMVEQTPDVSGADVVVASVAAGGSNRGLMGEAYRKLAEACGAAGARLVAIGGFTMLRPAEGAPRFVESGDLPEEYAEDAREMFGVLQDLERSPEQVDWLFVSPAAEFGSYNPGEATGHYRTSGDVALFDADGHSMISSTDLALGLLDEVERPTRRRAQITFAY